VPDEEVEEALTRTFLPTGRNPVGMKSRASLAEKRGIRTFLTTGRNPAVRKSRTRLAEMARTKGNLL
jgi:hypothetical protein